MSLQNVSNHKQLFIGTANPSYPTAGTIATPDNLAAGVVAVTTVDGVVLDNSAGSAGAVAAANTPIVIVQSQGPGKPLIKSAPFSKSQVLVSKGKLYSAAVQQVSYVGYNGTSGSFLPMISSGTNLILRNTFKTNFFQFSDKLMESIVGVKVGIAGVSDDQYALVNTLTKYAIQDVQKYVNIPYKVERLTSASVTSLAGTTAWKNATVTFKSSMVTYATAHGLSVGSYVKLGDNFYKVATVPSTTTITLDAPYQGSTGVVIASSATTPHTISVVNGSTSATLSANHGITVGTAVTLWIAGVLYTGTAGASAAITLSTAYAGTTNATASIAGSGTFTASTSADSIGIRFTGLPQTKFAPNIFRYETSKFVTTGTNFGDVPITNAAVVPVEGSGVYEQIAEEEFFFQLFEGMHDANLIQVPPVTMRSNVELTGKYSIIDFEVATQSGTMSFINNPIARKQIRIAVNSQTRANQLDSIADILEVALGLTVNTLI